MVPKILNKGLGLYEIGVCQYTKPYDIIFEYSVGKKGPSSESLVIVSLGEGRDAETQAGEVRKLGNDNVSR